MDKLKQIDEEYSKTAKQTGPRTSRSTLGSSSTTSTRTTGSKGGGTLRMGLTRSAVRGTSTTGPTRSAVRSSSSTMNGGTTRSVTVGSTSSTARTTMATTRTSNVPSLRTKKIRNSLKPKSTSTIAKTAVFHESSSEESEADEDITERMDDYNITNPQEYWEIQKHVNTMKRGNSTAVNLAMCSLRDFNLQQEVCQLCVRDVGGLEVLINILKTEDRKCRIGALKVLKEVAAHNQVRREIADLGGIQEMLKILDDDSDKFLMCLAAETIASIAKFTRARRAIRQHSGIQKLVAMLRCSQTPDDEDIAMVRSGVLALLSCSQSKRNKLAMQKEGVIPLIANLLQWSERDILVPALGIIQECGTEECIRVEIKGAGLTKYLVKHMLSSDQDLQRLCAGAIFQCAEEQGIRELVRQSGGLDHLVSFLDMNLYDKDLLAAAIGAIWKCAICPENAERLRDLNAIDQLVTCLEDQPQEVIVNAAGALGELARDGTNRLCIYGAGGFPLLVDLLRGISQDILQNATFAVGNCVGEPETFQAIHEQDGVRLLWSHLKSPSPKVVANAAWALCPCLKHAQDEAGQMVRTFGGGLELIVSLLNTEGKDLSNPDHLEVLISVCATIEHVAHDRENLAVMTDLGVVPRLSKLTHLPVNNERLRAQVGETITRCCDWKDNNAKFGLSDAILPIVNYLKENAKNPAVIRSTCRALHQLSKNPENCITMHQVGVVRRYLVERVGSADEFTQEAAAHCIKNIRMLALANQMAKYKKR